MPHPDALLVGQKVVFKEPGRYFYPDKEILVPKDNYLTVKEIALGDNGTNLYDDEGEYFIYYTFEESAVLRLEESRLYEKIYLGTKMSPEDIKEWNKPKNER